MAVSKILHMKDTGSSFHGKHLKSSLEYIMKLEKTQNGRLVGGINCQPDIAFEQMKDTKCKFNKIDKRQGYHLILSFKEGEVEPDTAFEITQKFVAEYLKKEYEAVYVVHDNTEHIHSHIVFNSVSFIDGKKYRYEKGDWARKIQPITNQLCREYGLSVLEIEEEERDGKKRNGEHYKEWNEQRDGKFVWSDMIKRDLDSCILQTNNFEEFLELLSEKGYEIKTGKHIAVKPLEMKRFRRCDTLGKEYSENAIRKRISKENLEYYQTMKQEEKPQIVRCYVKRYKRAKLSGLQKCYYAKLYRVGQLKKRPYSQAWKYKEDIKRMQQLQQQYLFLAKHNIYRVEELVATLSNLTDKKKDAHRDKSKVYRARQKCKELFDIADEMQELVAAEKAFIQGDNFFVEEHERWIKLQDRLKSQGYSYEEVEKLRAYYKVQSAEAIQKESVVNKELRIGKAIWKDISFVGEAKETEKDRRLTKEEQQEKERNDSRKQPSK